MHRGYQHIVEKKCVCPMTTSRQNNRPLENTPVSAIFFFFFSSYLFFFSDVGTVYGRTGVLLDFLFSHDKLRGDHGLCSSFRDGCCMYSRRHLRLLGMVECGSIS
ncbi:hypothetical protein BDV39DRAFT_65444 [Aspergillus sergii]|uniref:Uncharacterized protein n=1 Tax=Aspergillus sergii TaxID=1034303 RepID=A0A5N6X707_9EURO|nr:hypothetical protein BDV39DRAFT_65444 [Aspergillus sergii]